MSKNSGLFMKFFICQFLSLLSIPYMYFLYICYISKYNNNFYNVCTGYIIDKYITISVESSKGVPICLHNFMFFIDVLLFLHCFTHYSIVVLEMKEIKNIKTNILTYVCIKILLIIIYGICGYLTKAVIEKITITNIYISIIILHTIMYDNTTNNH